MQIAFWLDNHNLAVCLFGGMCPIWVIFLPSGSSSLKLSYLEPNKADGISHPLTSNWSCDLGDLLMYSGCKLPFETWSRNSQWEYSSLAGKQQNTGLRSATKDKWITRTQLLEIPSAVFDNLVNHVFCEYDRQIKNWHSYIRNILCKYIKVDLKAWRMHCNCAVPNKLSRRQNALRYVTYYTIKLSQFR